MNKRRDNTKNRKRKRSCEQNVIFVYKEKKRNERVRKEKKVKCDIIFKLSSREENEMKET